MFLLQATKFRQVKSTICLSTFMVTKSYDFDSCQQRNDDKTRGFETLKKMPSHETFFLTHDSLKHGKCPGWKAKSFKVYPYVRTRKFYILKLKELQLMKGFFQRDLPNLHKLQSCPSCTVRTLPQLHHF